MLRRTKKLLSILAILSLLALTVFAVSACSEPEVVCEDHTDSNCDNKCDTCQADVQIGHVDKNGDGVCEKCRECVTHVDARCDGECDNCYAEIPVVHLDDDEDGKCDRCGRRVAPLKMTATKSASVTPGTTLNSAFYIEWSDTTIKGATVTFTITVENSGESELTAVITDTVPEGTTYISGCDDKVNDQLTWTEVIPVGESKSVSYTVEITGKNLQPGTCIPADSAFVNGKRTTGYDLYVDRTLNEVDSKIFERAVRILSTSKYEARDFAKFAYYVAFSSGSASTNAMPEGSPYDAINAIFRSGSDYAAAIAPGMYGGKLAEKLSGARGAVNTPVTLADLHCGDVLYIKDGAEGSMYIFSDGKLHDITATFAAADTEAVLKALPEVDKYAVIRPSMVMTAFTPADPSADAEQMNAYQEAIVRTAEAFMLRGENLQYEDVWYGLNSNSGEHRWTHGEKQPEEYTYDEWGYVNCAVFTYDVYKTALGYALPGSMYTTYALTSNSFVHGMREFYFENTTPGQYTDSEMLSIQQEFMNTLQVGDLMVVRRKQEGKSDEVSGHVMLYIGNGMFIHSSGSSYKSESGVGVEVAEPTIRYHKVTDYFFDPSSVSGNPFRGPDEYGDRYVNKLLIVRPLNKFDGEIPENTVNRVQNMTDIRADKTSSHPSSVTVNPGDLITFTFTLQNIGDVAKTIEILDKAPAGTTYVSGCDNVSGDELRWSVTVGANEIVKVSYTVSVNNVADGTLIDGRDATVGGVMHRCAAIRVKNTLTLTEQDAIIAVIDELRAEGTTLKGLDLVNEIYKRALEKTGVFTTSDINAILDDGSESIFTKTATIHSGHAMNKLRYEETYYGSMLVDHLYGGMRVDSAAKLYDRTKMLKPHNLIVGDILLARTNSKEYVYIYAGEGNLINLTDGIGASADFETYAARIMYYGRNFAVLRPSYVFEDQA